MNKKAVESTERKENWTRSGCMAFVVIYGLSLIFLYIATTPTQTEDFTGRIAKEFSIAVVVPSDSGQGVTYRYLSLRTLNAGNLNVADLTFLLPEETVTIYVGDIHSAEILEDHGEWQLVAFHYSNTRTSTSIYRAYKDRIEPVSYRLTSSIGQMFGAMFLFIPALVLSIIVTVVLNWRTKHLTRMKGA